MISLHCTFGWDQWHTKNAIRLRANRMVACSCILTFPVNLAVTIHRTKYSCTTSLDAFVSLF
jgi:hypothetical protein